MQPFFALELLRVQDGILGIECAVDLFGGGAATPAAAIQQRTFLAGLGNGLLQGSDFRIGQKLSERPLENISQDSGRMVAEAHITVVVEGDGPAA